MNLLLDTSIWVEHLRRGALDGVIPLIRGRFVLWFDSVAGAELIAGCRSKRERHFVTRLLKPFRSAGRVVTPTAGDYERAAAALSRLREHGRFLASPGGALLDGLIAASAIRIGALLVTANWRDFNALREQLPLQIEAFDAFAERLTD